MDGQTFRSRVIELLQKSRKAVRVYTTVGRNVANEQAYYSELQVKEWRSINTELLKALSAALESENQKEVAAKIFHLRDTYYNDWRVSESELRDKQKKLCSAAENGDFIRASLLSQQLVTTKARVQATQAVHHELQEVINKSGITQPVIELSRDKAVGEPPETPAGNHKVIHLAARKGR